MDCNELLRRQLANRLICQTQQIAIGPTGSTGPIGPPGPPSSTSIFSKSFTIFLDYSAANAISRVYIPPGLFANPPLSEGGIFDTDQTDLTFVGTPRLTMGNTKYAFIVGLFANGYVRSGHWQLVSPSQTRPGNGYLNVTMLADYTAIIGADLGAINGGNLAVYPSSGSGAGFLGMITLFYL